MTFVDAVKSVYRKYFTFSGRAARSEFWWYMLFMLLMNIALAIVFGDNTTVTGPGYLEVYSRSDLVGDLWNLFNLIPTLAVASRRLHDTDRSGWWQLLYMVPLIGAIVLIVWWVARGTPGQNRFGADPLS